MTFWRILDPSAVEGFIIVGRHNPWWILGALLLAVIGASVLMPAMQRFRDRQHRLIWLTGGVCTVVVGVGGMHVTAVLTYHLPLVNHLSFSALILSALPLVCVSTLIISQAHRFAVNQNTWMVFAGLWSTGTVALYLISIETIQTPALPHYRPMWLGLSLLLAYALPLLVFYCVRQRMKRFGDKSKIALVVAGLGLGFSATVFHILALTATYYVVPDDSVFFMPVDSPFSLTAFLGCVAAMAVLLIVGFFLDQRWADLKRLLQLSEQRFARMANNSGAAIFTYHADGFLYSNPALSNVLGYSQQEIAQLTISQALGKPCARYALDIISHPENEGKSFQKQFELRAKDGSLRWLFLSITVERQKSEWIGMASGFDMTEQKQAKADYHNIANKDALTRLASRAMFIDRIDHHLALLNRRGGDISSCVLLIDIDNFKVINDTLGHASGDSLLKSVGERLLRSSRTSDTLARLSGDEFVLLAEGAKDIYDIQSIAEKLLQEFKTPVDIGGQCESIELSIGALPIVPKAYLSSDDVLRDAEIALHRAKKINGSYWVIFNEELDASARRMRQLQIELKETIDRGNLQFFYQPIIDMAQQRVVGFESLARWQRETGEWVSPGEFIPLAERSGNVSDIGLWALKRAAEQVSCWSKKFNCDDIYISINIAAVSFSDERFYQLLDSVFDEFKLKAGQIRIELTERMLMENSEMIIGQLEKFTRMGCNLMLDDFGTGYSSLSYLHRLPINTVKIDRSFIENLNRDRQAPAIVKSIVALAENLDMSVISEGVETPQQSEQLLQLGCQVVQGFLFAKPMPPESAQAYYEQYNRTGNLISDDSLTGDDFFNND